MADRHTTRGRGDRVRFVLETCVPFGPSRLRLSAQMGDFILDHWVRNAYKIELTVGRNPH
jgi:hypothetical protein